MNKNLLPVAICSTLVLAACGHSSTSITQKQLLENPFYANTYARFLVDDFVQVIIEEHEATQDPDKLAYLENIKDEWVTAGKESSKIIRESKQGALIAGIRKAQGKMLIHDNTLHMNERFVVFPDPSARVYLTKAVEPRKVEFPDESAVEIGKLISPIGRQSYQLPEEVDVDTFKTVAIWSPELEVVIAFAQIR